MRHPFLPITLLALALTATGTLQAQRERAIQLSLLTPVQLFPEADAITGVRLNLLYGRNSWVRGLDLGLVNHTTSGTSKGVQFGLVSINRTNFIGWQYGAVNLVGKKFEGFQQGIYNGNDEGSGLQLGFVNTSQNFKGVQIGIVNYARQLNGLQIGIVNIITKDGAFPVFPIVNWSF